VSRNRIPAINLTNFSNSQHLLIIFAKEWLCSFLNWLR